jgi:hypothetical protein
MTGLAGSGAVGTCPTKRQLSQKQASMVVTPPGLRRAFEILKRSLGLALPIFYESESEIKNQ